MNLSARFDMAFAFAADLHRNHHRKSTSIPYLSHLMSVAALVLEDGGSEGEAIAALLHDAIEDKGDDYPGGRAGLRNCIAATFGPHVLRIVEGCTDDEWYVKDDKASASVQRQQWLGRKQAYIQHLSVCGNDQVRRVSCADKLHNILSIRADLAHTGDGVWSRFRVGREDQLWYYSALADVFNRDTRLEKQFREAVRLVVSMSAASTAEEPVEVAVGAHW